MAFGRLGGGGRREAELAELRARLAQVEQRLAEHDFSRSHAEDRLADVERTGDALATLAGTLDRIQATTALVAALPASPELVSVVMPTRDRAHLLPRALDSVRAQRHEAWELVAVDDGSTDETPALLAAAAREDPRIRVLRTEGGGSSAARNAALDALRGRYVAYLDDDNLMGPQWLRGIVWAFDRHPEAQVGYGVRVMDTPPVGPPWLEFQPWDRQRMQATCMIDQNVLTHHAGVPELRYDEHSDIGSDWDAAMRATEDRDPVMIPLLATIYGTDAGDRLSARPEAFRSWVAVQRAALRRRPLRVLGVDLASPPLSDDEAATAVRGWQAAGAEVGWCAEGRADPALGIPWHGDLGEAIRVFGPTVVAVHAARVVPAQLARLHRAGRAFLIVAPSDGDPGELARARAHPLCAGVWSPQSPAIDELLPGLDLVRARQCGVPDPEGVLAELGPQPLP